MTHCASVVDNRSFVLVGKLTFCFSAPDATTRPRPLETTSQNGVPHRDCNVASRARCVCLFVCLPSSPELVPCSLTSRSSQQLLELHFLQKHSPQPIRERAARMGCDVRPPKTNLLVRHRQQEEDPPPAPEEGPYEPVGGLLSRYAAAEPGKTSTTRTV